MPTRVWCTLVMLKPDYACGAAVVARTLRNHGTKYPIWCMVTDDIPADCIEFLRGEFDNIVTVPLISHETVPMKSKKQNEIYGGWIHHSFTKWNIMNPELFPVEKVILIDADMMFLQNCDELFDMPAPAATFSSPWAVPYHRPHGKPNPYGELQHGAIVPNAKIRRGFAGGILALACMVLVKPSVESYDTMLTILRRDKQYGSSNCISGFDEQLLAETWLASAEPIHHIHQQYNWVVGKKKWLKPNVKPKTQQYYNGKPWKESRDESEWDDVRMWYVIWDQVIEKNNDFDHWRNM